MPDAPDSHPGLSVPPGLFGELEAGLAAGASDWHFAPGEPCRARVDGGLVLLGEAAPDESRLQQLLCSALGRAEPVPPGLDASFEHRGERFRLHSFSAGGRLCFTLRHVPGRPRELGSLGAPPAFRARALEARHGLILVTGPAGSGKSATLAAAVDHLARRRAGVILTFEDPIECRHRDARGLVRQLEKGRDFARFDEALRGALRGDPDVLMVGELRDPETIAAALTAAETGHLVLGTLHCASAADAVSRVVDGVPPERAPEARAQLAKQLVAVLAQRLVKAARGGRLAAFELLLATPAVRHLAARPGGHAFLDQEIAAGKAHGMVSMDQSLEELCRRGVLARAEALRCAAHPEALERALEERR